MKFWLSLILSCSLLTPAFAADPVTARQQVFKDYKRTMGSMGKFIKGEQAFSKDEFAKLAAHMDELAQLPWQYFPAGSNQGKTEARAEIWSRPAEFKAATDKHKTAVAQLKQRAAQANSLDEIKPAFTAVQQSCKACHDQFKTD